MRAARHTTSRVHELPLTEFIPAITPRFKSPTHLARIIDVLERIDRGDRVKVVISTPPRHGKTETLLHGIAWMLARDPRRQISYISYAQKFAQSGSRKARGFAVSAGVKLAVDQRSKSDWQTGTDDGGLWATSIGGTVTGKGFHLMVIDDAVKDRADAESPVIRDSTGEWFTDTAYTRLEPNGSVIVNMTRWHVDDLAGRLIAKGWDHINLPALNDKGEALWPERFNAEALEDIRKEQGDYGFYSLYQGSPRPKGGALFNDTLLYSGELPDTNVTIGVDLAYSEKSKADWSVAVVMVAHPTIPRAVIVWDVIRVQLSADKFIDRLKSLTTKWHGAPLAMYVGGTELGMMQVMRSMGLSIISKPAIAKKFERAQRMAAAWNNGRVFVRRCGDPWVTPYLNEVLGFTGDEKRNDDQVDASVSAFDQMMIMGSPSTENRPVTFGKPRW